MPKFIAKPLGLNIKNLKIHVSGIPYIVILKIKNNALDSTYCVPLGWPWLKDAKVIHDWGSNIIIIQGTNIVIIIHVTKKLGIETKQPKVFSLLWFS